MRTRAAPLRLILPCLAAPWLGATSAAAAELRAEYRTYAAGLPVAEVEAGFGLGPWTYQMRMVYRTTGLVGFFYHGHQFNQVDGTWQDGAPVPREFQGVGEWHGEPRVARIDYQDGKPVVRALVPPNEGEREPVPPALQANTIDSLSAIADLIHQVATTGRCEATVHTYDGRRATEVSARTDGPEVLAPSSRSSYAGSALRCSFRGELVAGFRLAGDRAADRKPLHGVAWLAQVAPNTPPIPVRMSFETRWFGDVTMYLTGVTLGADAMASVR
ncbi:MAG: DUF3108 domain-containing protein [Rhodospirillales bacterium]|nr:DUF3108 domain-containing protein [Rhodospirillales bacterium]